MGKITDFLVEIKKIIKMVLRVAQGALPSPSPNSSLMARTHRDRCRGSLLLVSFGGSHTSTLSFPLWHGFSQFSTHECRIMKMQITDFNFLFVLVLPLPDNTFPAEQFIFLPSSFPEWLTYTHTCPLKVWRLTLLHAGSLQKSSWGVLVQWTWHNTTRGLLTVVSCWCRVAAFQPCS